MKEQGFPRGLRDRVLRVRRGLRRLRPAPGVEAIHALRVATRRLRAVLALCASGLGRRERRRVRAFLRGLTRRLGVVRALDVSRAVVAAVARTHLARADRGQARAVRRELAAARPRATAALLAFGGSPRRIALLDRLLTGLCAAPDPEELAATVTRARRRLVRRLREAADEHTKSAFHACRIALKKLRYAVEALAIGTGRDVEAVVERLRAVQTALGDLHDTEVVVHHLDGSTPLTGLRCRRAAAASLRARLQEREAILRGEGNLALARFRREIARAGGRARGR